MITGQRKQLMELGRLSVLIAEDHEINRVLIRKIIESWGFAVSIAENGMEVLQKLEQEHFDLILMDIQMPEMDGIGATRSIRSLKDPVKSSIPIIAVTANIQPGAREAYETAGMNTCISKPLNEPELLNIIYMLLRSKSGNLPETTEEISKPVKAEKLYDLSLIRSLSGGDEVFVKKMIDLFIETMPDSMDKLKNSIINKDWKQVANTAHKMKSTIDAMAITSIKEDIRMVENNSRQMTGLEKTPALAENICTTLNEVMIELRKNLN